MFSCYHLSKINAKSKHILFPCSERREKRGELFTEHLLTTCWVLLFYPSFTLHYNAEGEHFYFISLLSVQKP